MQNEELFKKLDDILNYISVEMGERLTGLEKSKKVEVYAGNHFNTERTELVFKDKNILVKLSYYTNGCNVRGEYVKIRTVDELKRSDLTDEIAVLHGVSTKEQIMLKSFPFYNPEWHQKIIQLLVEKMPVAIITIVEKDESVFEDGDFAIPSVYMTKNEGETLLENDGDIKVVINTVREESYGANVIARLNPAKSQKLVVTAHMDTKTGTSGALDKATGIAILLLFSHLIKPEDIDFCLELLLLNGEDYYSIPGHLAYVETYLRNTKDILLARNSDGVGLKNSLTAVSLMKCDSKQKIG